MKSSNANTSEQRSKAYQRRTKSIGELTIAQVKASIAAKTRDLNALRRRLDELLGNR